MVYQMALKLHKLLNENTDDLDFEQITVIDQLVCTKRQLNFELLQNFRSKIGSNTTANKLYPLSKVISLSVLGLDYVHFLVIFSLTLMGHFKHNTPKQHSHDSTMYSCFPLHRPEEMSMRPSPTIYYAW